MKTSTKPSLLLNKASLKRLEALRQSTPQSILLTGQTAVGKHQSALWLAEELLGDNWKSKLIEIIPSDTGSISIEQIRQIKTVSQFKKTDANDLRVILISDAHTMTHEAQNSFLKILEEPSKDLLLILLSPEPQSLLPTIMSRLSIIDLQAPSFKELVQLLPDYDEAELRKLYLMTNGAPRHILDLSQNPDGDYMQAIREGKEILTLKPVQRLGRINELTKDKIKLAELLSAMSTILVISMKSSLQKDKSINKALERIEAITEAQTALRKNHNTKLTLTLLFSRL